MTMTWLWPGVDLETWPLDDLNVGWWHWNDLEIASKFIFKKFWDDIDPGKVTLSLEFDPACFQVSRLDQPIESLDDLAKQFKTKYAPQVSTSTETYFRRMKDIEDRFYT